MRILRNIFAFFALPAVAAGAYTAFKSFLSFAGASGQTYTPFWIGILCYAVFQAAFYKPMRTYVFGHELTHAFAGILSGARIKKFKVGKESGSVVLTKDNVWITLAPYFFPLYTFAIIAVYLTLGWFYDIKELYGYFLFFAGVSIAFHAALTVYIISIGQPDLKVYGVFFSCVLIAAINVLVFSLLMVLCFPNELNAGELFGAMFQNAADAYKFIISGVMEIWSAFQKTS